MVEMSSRQIKCRLEYLRQELRHERISWHGVYELQCLAPHIDKDDVELLSAASVSELDEEVNSANS